MLKFRNISLLRRIYVWGLSILTRIAYAPDQRALPPEADPHPTAQRIRRINAELESGPKAWQQEFLHLSGFSERETGFQLGDITPLLRDGMEAVVDDTLTRCFTADTPHPWNFLTRNIPPGPWRMTPYQSLLWLVGVWARYCVFLPFRVLLLAMGVTTFTMGWPFASLMPGKSRKKAARQWLLRYLASVVVSSWSGYVKFHGQRPKKQPNQIYVSNHSSLIDLFVLNKDYNFSCIGQAHTGLAGFLQALLLAAQDHVWFDREEGSDRRAVQRLLREHVADGTKEPMLVFPEGTCTHSEYCVMFKKGSFEMGGTVHPIAMRYRQRFGDPFWNSKMSSFPRHLFDLMTSWAVVCDVYYLEPQTIRDDESAVEFANRVKRHICERAGLISLNWDGYLKRQRISPKFLDARQRAMATMLIRRYHGEMPRAASASVLNGVDGGLPQTAATGAGVPLGGGMDTLILDKPLPAVGSAVDAEEGGSTRVSRASLYREVLSLRRRTRDEPAQQQPMFAHPAVKFAAGAARDAVRWMVGIGLLLGATLVTNRFLPRAWKEALRPYVA